MNKIAFISTNKSSWGGSEYLWYYTFLRFSKAGKEVVASVPRWKNLPDEIRSIISNGMNVKFNTDTSGLKKAANRFLPKSLQLDYKEDGYKFLFEFKPDLVVINQGGNTGGIELMEFCIKNKFRFVTIAQAANEAKWPSDELNKRLSAALPGSVRNYYVSKANLNLTQIQIGQDIPNSKVIFNPFNVQFENDIEYPEVKDNYVLANVARHEFFAKGQDILFEVLSDKKWKERNLSVDLYGKGENTYSLNKLKNYFDLKNVNIAGHVDPQVIWKNSHALILTSRYEGLPLALVEAMLCGRFGIVTEVSGNPEIVTDGVNGFLAKAPKAEFADEALERAWSRKEEWKSIGQKAREYARMKIPKDPVEYFYEELINLNL
ncbi:MAG: glycosyltransferase [Ignavibacteria bacterium]|nr:glycosyltransferase [Ignavibacteria bacterium]